MVCNALLNDLAVSYASLISLLHSDSGPGAVCRSIALATTIFFCGDISWSCSVLVHAYSPKRNEIAGYYVVVCLDIEALSTHLSRSAQMDEAVARNSCAHRDRNLFHADIRCSRHRNLISVESGGYRSANPVVTEDAIAFTQMYANGYRAAILKGNKLSWFMSNADILSMSASEQSPWLYYERTDSLSTIWRTKPGTSHGGEYITLGQQPYLSNNSEWLVFIREEHGIGHLWIRSLATAMERQLTFPNVNVLEAAVNNFGDVIAVIGSAGSPHLISIGGAERGIVPIVWSQDDRFPSYSADGKRIAFSRRDGGAWHLWIRDLISGEQQQLTSGPCNALQPFWSATNSLLYATDCGRGLGLSAIAQIRTDVSLDTK